MTQEREYNGQLVATVRFQDVDGNQREVTYDDVDLFHLLDNMAGLFMDEIFFPQMQSPVFSGMNGIVDISKPISIRIEKQPFD